MLAHIDQLALKVASFQHNQREFLVVARIVCNKWSSSKCRKGHRWCADRQWVICRPILQTGLQITHFWLLLLISLYTWLYSSILLQLYW